MAKPGREAKKRRGKSSKIVVVDIVTKALQEGHGMVLLNNNGLSVAKVTALRDTLRDSNVFIKVVKNTLLLRSLEAAGIDLKDAAAKGGMSEDEANALFTRCTMVAIGMDDPVSPAKLLTKFQEENEGKIELKGGYLDGELLTAARIADLAKLPSREELIARMMGSMNAPAQNLVYALNATVSKVVYAMDAYRRKLEESNAA